MERRKDYRHDLTYSVSIKCPRTQRTLDGVATDRVSASGLSFVASEPHGFREGDLVELQIVANVEGQTSDDLLVMATQATIIRKDALRGAVKFEAPLAY